MRVDSGHRTRLDDATSTRAEAAMLLHTYVAIGAAYVRGEAVAEDGRLIVTAAGRSVSLTRPFVERLRGWMRDRR